MKSNGNKLNGVGLVVYPARDMKASVAAWTAMLGQEPLFQTPTAAGFLGADGVQIGLARLSPADHPLPFFKVDDVEKAHTELIAGGATPDDKGIVTLPGRRMAVLTATDGNLVGIFKDA